MKVKDFSKTHLKSPFEVGFSSQKIALLFVAWLAITDVLVWLARSTGAWPVQALLFVGLSLLPGAALLRALRVRLGSFLEGLVYSFGLSILILMLSGLAANQILHGLGVSRPLELAGILGMWNVVTLGCIITGAVANRQPLRLRGPLWPTWSRSTGALVLASFLLPLLAAGGAFRLNNGGDALVAGLAICWAAGIMVYTFLFRNRLGDATLAWCIFMIGLSVLLMSALRSWDITGHDIAHEFRVYSLTHIYGYWNIGTYQDPYNACLSITILPEMYAKLLHVSGLISFKLILQIIFAVVPVVVYLSLRRYVSKLGALVGCGLFISYPTFINDSAMLTRQGVAYLFFALALLTATNISGKKVHKPLFLLCGLGMVWSHYSTSYMFVALFALALGCKLLLQLFRGQRWKLHGDAFTVLSPVVLTLLTLATFLWYAQVTATSGGLVTTLGHSIANVPHLLSADNKSSDTAAALVLATHKSQTDIYDSYLAHPVVSNKIVDALQYAPQITTDDLPVTPLGKRLSSLGIQPSFTTAMRQQFAKLLQLLAGMSVFYATLMFVRKKSSVLPFDLICFCMAGVTVLLFMVALPNLSLNYGILRAFQQALIFLAIPLILLLSLLGRRLRPRLKLGIVTASMTALFALFSGLIAQLLGGVGAPLTLNNHGLYYGLYYTTRADLLGYAWLKAQLPAQTGVQAASYTKATMHDPKYPFKRLGVLPTQRPAGSYVFLDQAQITAHKLYVYHQGSPLITTFPLDYYNEQTNHIYSTATTGVYR